MRSRTRARLPADEGPNLPDVNFSIDLPMASSSCLLCRGARRSTRVVLINVAILLFLGRFHGDAASRDQRFHPRSYGLLTRYGILSSTEAGGDQAVLTAAAFTIAAALTAVLTSSACWQQAGSAA